jgi:hypothetical protein
LTKPPDANVNVNVTNKAEDKRQARGCDAGQTATIERDRLNKVLRSATKEMEDFILKDIFMSKIM